MFHLLGSGARGNPCPTRCRLDGFCCLALTQEPCFSIADGWNRIMQVQNFASQKLQVDRCSLCFRLCPRDHHLIPRHYSTHFIDFAHMFSFAQRNLQRSVLSTISYLSFLGGAVAQPSTLSSGLSYGTYHKESWWQPLAFLRRLS